MVKKLFLLSVLFLFVFLTSGCTLVKGTQGFAQGAQEGFKEDAKAVNTADAWVKDNLW
jgi:hypothetical protein